LIEANGRVYGKYCKNRFCTLCSGIRKAEIINKYLPIVSSWKEPYFVTLTIKAVKAHELGNRVKDMLRAFKKILNKYKKRNQRGTGIKLMGIRSLECNFNPLSRTYNPHLHLIVPNKEIASLLIKEWCEIWTIKDVNPKGQHFVKVWDKEKALIEIVKYSTKIFTDPIMAKKGKAILRPYIYLSAMDNIVGALQKHRIFERSGFNIPKKEKPVKQSKFVTEYTYLTYDSKEFDWVDDNDEFLTGYTPTPSLLAILELNVNTDLN
jgi:hypothetical protein